MRICARPGCGNSIEDRQANVKFCTSACRRLDWQEKEAEKAANDPARTFWQGMVSQASTVAERGRSRYATHRSVRHVA